MIIANTRTTTFTNTLNGKFPYKKVTTIMRYKYQQCGKEKGKKNLSFFFRKNFEDFLLNSFLYDMSYNYKYEN